MPHEKRTDDDTPVEKRKVVDDLLLKTPPPLSKPLRRIVPSLDPARQPALQSDDFDELLSSWHGREKYIENIGYAPVSREFCEALRRDLQGFGVQRFVEIVAGSGYMTLLLNRMGFEGVGYTLMKDNGHFENSPYYREVQKAGCLIDQDITTLVCDEAPDMVLASWIPLGGGEEVMAFFENQWHRGIDTPLFVLIGESPGGATASDAFFDWLERHFDEAGRNEAYTPFDNLHDACVYYKRKPL